MLLASGILCMRRRPSGHGPDENACLCITLDDELE
jgi:hypothetical protein